MTVAVLLLLGLGAAAAAGVAVAGGRGGPSAGAGHAPTPGSTGQSIRRFFQYLLLAGLLFAAASGVTGLLGRLITADRQLIRDDATLALQITFVVIALPIWAALAWWTHRRMRAQPDEVHSLGWAAYLTLVSIVSLVVALVGWHRSVGAVAGAGALQGGPVAQALVWTLVWAAHYGWGQRVTPATRLRGVHLLGSLTGLVASAIGLGMVLSPTFRVLTGLSGAAMAAPATWPTILAGAAVLLVGAVAWWAYWLRHTVDGPRDTGWLALVLLAGVAGGLLFAVLTASLLAHDVLVWLVGDPRFETAARHFHAAPAQLASVVVGLLAWWYHREVLQAHPVRSQAPQRTEVRRVYEYLLSAVGLLAASAGLVMVLVTIVEAIASGRDLVVGGTALNALLAALVLLAVGLPIWWWHWRQAQRARAVDPPGELASRTRRAYLLVLFGVMGVAAVIALIVLVYLVLQDALGDGVDLETLRRVRFALGILVTTSLLSAYHSTIFRSDRAEADRLEGEGLASEGLAGEGLAGEGPATGSRTVQLTVPRLDVAVRDGLLARAAEAGVPVEDYVRRVLEEAAAPGQGRAGS